jgi:hypothetical protein
MVTDFQVVGLSSKRWIKESKSNLGELREAVLHLGTEVLSNVKYRDSAFAQGLLTAVGVEKE